MGAALEAGRSTVGFARRVRRESSELIGGPLGGETLPQKLGSRQGCDANFKEMVQHVESGTTTAKIRNAEGKLPPADTLAAGVRSKRDRKVHCFALIRQVFRMADLQNPTIEQRLPAEQSR